MKYLIVNGDDFGASRGVNRGIFEAHRRGILTSASLMVNAPGSEEAAALSQSAPLLSVGLHADLPSADGRSGREELHRQLARFKTLLGRLPTHLDSHHNVHRDARLLPHFLELAQQYELPLREHSAVRYFSKFYGRWGGETHTEQINSESLARMMATDIEEGVTELSCHPGYVEAASPSGYSAEREIELRTLCDPAIRRVLAEQSIQLISYQDLTEVLLTSPT
jgi:predicted glycoside hydrolase/deacetylase ChbG (UPF0249 family)